MFTIKMDLLSTAHCFRRMDHTADHREMTGCHSRRHWVFTITWIFCQMDQLILSSLHINFISQLHIKGIDLTVSTIFWTSKRNPDFPLPFSAKQSPSGLKIPSYTLIRFTALPLQPLYWRWLLWEVTSWTYLCPIKGIHEAFKKHFYEVIKKSITNNKSEWEKNNFIIICTGRC